MPRSLTAVPDVATQPTLAVETSGGATVPPTAPPRTVKSRPRFALPTDRLNLDKQVSALSIYARLSMTSAGGATAEDLGAGLGLIPNTAGLAAKFFVEAGWLQLVRRGLYAATPALKGYQQILNISTADLEDAKVELRAAASRAWFWTCIQPMLSGGAPRTQVIRALVREANAGDHISQINILIDWLAWLRLIKVAGDTIWDLTDTAVVDDEDGDQPDGTEIAPAPAPTRSREIKTPIEDVEPPVGDELDLDQEMFVIKIRLTERQARDLPDERFQALVALANRFAG